ncbi:transmembrane protein 221 [Cyanistes caeruleus]|uniref:transmembrane protein 221 n=1 Tax=Cyanistes caeruleus TaxID=156563 RepID=UPI000CDB2BE6|nr:transmembrane protein 221 [Cyanistes caeruleus]
MFFPGLGAFPEAQFSLFSLFSLFSRADWFLLDSRSVRHAAIGLFCCGVCLYLTALALFMLLLFQLEAGIAGACILTSGILVLLISVLHALLRASHISQISQRSRWELSQSLYENDCARPGEDGNAAPAEIRREFSFPLFPQRKSQPGSASSSNLSSAGGARSKESQRESQRESKREFQRESSQRELSQKDFQRESQRELSRTHRTLSADSGLLQEQGKPWNVITREMRNAMARKSTKDSTLV